LLFKANIPRFVHIERNLAIAFEERLTAALVPFRKLIQTIEKGSIIEPILFVLNFILLIPLGILLPFYLPKKRALAAIVAFPVGVELVQLFTGLGGLETTDIIMNSLGGLFGIWIYFRFRPRIEDKTVNKVCLWVSCISAPLTVYALINTVLALPRYISLWIT
jgi:glycopeptide antibiotics resistance protein